MSKTGVNFTSVQITLKRITTYNQKKQEVEGINKEIGK